MPVCTDAKEVTPMWKRRRTWLLLFMLAFGLVLVYFEPTRCVRGWLHGEAFYDGRPTSYWRGVVVDALEIDWANFPNFTWADRAKRRIGYEPVERNTWQLMCDTDADPVLRELAQDENPKVAGFARDILNADRDCVNEHDKTYQVWLGLIKKHNMR